MSSAGRPTLRHRAGWSATSCLHVLVFIGLAAQLGCVQRIANGPWPTSSDTPVAPSPHPSLGAHIGLLGTAVDSGFRLIAFGDQRALADGEWQTMNAAIAAREGREPSELPLLAVVDTGDILADGNFSDQFAMLAQVLEPLRAYPYLVGVGNHEVKDNEPGPARGHVVQFLGKSVGELPPPSEPVKLREDRLYYRVDVGGARLLFLDTNDLVYDADGAGEKRTEPGERAREQLQWLVEQLSDVRGAHTTIVMCHHPFVHSSRKHRAQARKMWGIEFEGRTLPQILAEGGVDLVLAGHTHTYEHFRLGDASGNSLELVNVSGRPRNSFLFFGASKRRARDLAGSELDYFTEFTWPRLEGWKIEQIGAMIEDEANQFAEIRVTPDALTVEVFFVDEDAPDGIRSGGVKLIGQRK